MQRDNKIRLLPTKEILRQFSEPNIIQILHFIFRDEIKINVRKWYSVVTRTSLNVIIQFYKLSWNKLAYNTISYQNTCTDFYTFAQ